MADPQATRLPISEPDPTSPLALLEGYHKQRFPALSRRSEQQPQAVMDLFRRSGYLSLRQDLVPSQQWLSAPWPTTLTREALYTAGDGTLLGHIAITRAYRRAWLGHEIATLRDHPEAYACRQTLYQHYACWPRLLDGEQTLVFGYYNRKRPWHQRMFEGFAATVGPDVCAVQPMDRFRLAPETPGPAAEDQDPALEVGALDASERARLAALIAGRWPALVCAAFDLEAAQLESDCLHPAYQEAGLQRTRTALAFRRRGILVAAALCEWTDGHLSLFNVLNAAQVFVLPDAALTESERRSLIRGVRRFFAARGVDAPLVTAHPGDLPEDPDGGLHLVETMGCIVWSAEGLRRYETYVDDRIAAYPTPGTARGEAS